MDKILNYLPSVSEQNESKMNDDFWDTAVDLHNKKQYLDCFNMLLDYIDPDLRKNHATENGYSIPHGSITVNIDLSNDRFSVDSPFVSLKDAKRIPLMRKLAELKQHPLNLASIRLENDEAHFFFSCPIHNIEPYKIYNILREICVFADMYDDEFIEKYNATRLQDPQINQFDEATKNEVVANIQTMIDEGMVYYDHYMNKKYERHTWYLLNILLKRIEFYAQPQGFYRTELERAVDLLYSRNMSMQDILLKVKAQLNNFRSYDEDRLKEALYTINTFVPSKYKGNIDNIKENWENTHEEAKQLMSNGNYELASLLLQSSFYNLFYYNYVNEDVKKVVLKGLEEAQGKGWNEGAQILYSAMDDVMEDNLEEFDFEMPNGMDISKAMEQSIAQSMEMFQNMMKGMNNK